MGAVECRSCRDPVAEVGGQGDVCKWCVVIAAAEHTRDHSSRVSAASRYEVPSGGDGRTVWQIVSWVIFAMVIAARACS